MTKDSDHQPPAGEDPAGQSPADDDGARRDAAGKAAGPAAADVSESSRRAPASRARGGRLLASLALLLALGAAGGAGWLYYELVHRGTLRAVDERVAAVEQAVRAVDGQLDRLERLEQRQREELEAFRQRQQAALNATETALRESLARVARQAPPSTGEWQRAEVQYLLRIANHRLLMERDVSGALRLLEAADTILAQLDDFALHDVRASLADEIAALETVEGVDVQGLFLRLEALKRDLDRLPLRLPDYLAVAEETPAPAADDFWSVLEERLSGFFRVRRFEGAVRPLLAPEEAVYLELNLRLMLERAQLAAVRREQLIYEESLATAAEWVRTYLDQDERRVERMTDEIDELLRVDLERPLPDISGSLNALRDVLRNPA